ncbi:MAG: glycoside hydrolase family 19 protein [Candidatus Methylophosphatis roskildensis]
MTAADPPDYRRAGNFDRAVFQAEFADQFSRNARYSAAAVPDMLVLLGMIERDPNIIDIRWAAYILATVMWETTSPTTVTRPALNRKGKPLLDKKGQPVIVKERKWLMTMAPVDEIGHGKGRRYHEPVKVKVLSDGGVRITEQDGDQFSISAAGAIKPLTRRAVMGTQDGGAAVKAYDDDDGSEQAYYGRGYVQLTWWSNYAASGVAIGRGLDLLLDPELVKSPEIAYALMSHGMRTGQGFANGHKLAQYFSGALTNYAGARRMVNGQDHAADIAAIATRFEAILLKSSRSDTAADTPP